MTSEVFATPNVSLVEKSAYAVGDAVEVVGYRGVWVVAAIDYFDAGIPMEKPLQLRTLDRDDVAGHPTRFGTIPMAEAERYVWLRIDDAEVTRARPDVVTPKVTMIRRGVDAHGSWKHAVVDGRRHPEVNFSDVPYADFVEWLKTKGCVIPTDIAVYDDRVRVMNGSGNAHGATRLCDVIERERGGLLDVEPAAQVLPAPPVSPVPAARDEEAADRQRGSFPPG